MKLWTLMLCGMLAAVSVCAEDWKPQEKKAAVNDGVISIEVALPIKYSSISFKKDIEYKANKCLTFEYKATSPHKVAYIGLNFRQGKKSTVNTVPASSEWKKASVDFSKIVWGAPQRGPVEDGTVFESLTIYAKSELPEGTQGVVKLELRNLQITEAK